MTEQNVALTEGKDGWVVHRADCSYARFLASIGEPVVTLVGIQNPIPDEYERHTCLTDEETQA